MSTDRYPIIPRSLYPTAGTPLSEEAFRAWFDAINAWGNKQHTVEIVPAEVHYFVRSVASGGSGPTYGFTDFVLSFQHDMGEITEVTVSCVSLIDTSPDGQYTVHTEVGDFTSTLGDTVSIDVNTPTDIRISLDDWEASRTINAYFPWYLLIEVTVGGSTLQRIVPVTRGEEAESAFFGGELVCIRSSLSEGITVRAYVDWPDYIPSGQRRYKFECNGSEITSDSPECNFPPDSLDGPGEYTVTCQPCDTEGNPYPNAETLVVHCTISETLVLLREPPIDPDTTILCFNPRTTTLGTETIHYSFKIDVGSVFNTALTTSYNFILTLNNADRRIGPDGTSQLLDAIETVYVWDGSTLTSVDRDSLSGGISTDGVNPSGDQLIYFVKLDSSQMLNMRYGFTDSPDNGVLFDWHLEVQDTDGSTVQSADISNAATCTTASTPSIDVSISPPLSVLSGGSVEGEIIFDVDGIISRMCCASTDDPTFYVQLELISGESIKVASYAGSDGIADTTLGLGDSIYIKQSDDAPSEAWDLSTLLIGSHRVKFKTTEAGTRRMRISVLVNCSGELTTVVQKEFDLVVYSAYSDLPHPVVTGTFISDFGDGPDVFNDLYREFVFFLSSSDPDICELASSSDDIVEVNLGDSQITAQPLRIRIGSVVFRPTDFETVRSCEESMEPVVSRMDHKIQVKHPVASGATGPVPDVYIYVKYSNPSKVYIAYEPPGDDAIVVAIVHYSVFNRSGDDDFTSSFTYSEYIKNNKVWNRMTPVTLPYGGELLRALETKVSTGRIHKIIAHEIPHTCPDDDDFKIPVIMSSDIPSLQTGAVGGSAADNYFGIGAWREYNTEPKRPAGAGIITSYKHDDGVSRHFVLTPWGSFVFASTTRGGDGFTGRLFAVPDLMLSFFLNKDQEQTETPSTDWGDSSEDEPEYIFNLRENYDSIWNLVDKATVIVTPTVIPVASSSISYANAKVICYGEYSSGILHVKSYLKVWDEDEDMSTFYPLPCQVFVLASTGSPGPSDNLWRFHLPDGGTFTGPPDGAFDPPPGIT